MEKIKPLLLIAEDDPDDQLLIQEIMDNCCTDNLEMIFFQDGVELIDYLENQVGKSSRPKLVLLDLNMPRKDGRTVLQEINANQSWSGIPVVVFTTSRLDEDAWFCKQYGVAGYYHKPSSMSEYRRIITNLYREYFI